MAEGFLKSFDSNLEVFSAGTLPADKVNPNTIIVMNEVGIDLSNNSPKSVNQFLNDSFDYVITVCGGAKETCPAFLGNVKNRLQIGFEDPAEAQGNPKQILNVYRRIRDKIYEQFNNFYQLNIRNN